MTKKWTRRALLVVWVATAVMALSVIIGGTLAINRLSSNYTALEKRADSGVTDRNELRSLVEEQDEALGEANQRLRELGAPPVSKPDPGAADDRPTLLQGPRGPIGPQGPQGARGPKGSKGNDGANGIGGQDGETGATGGTGAQGPPGPAGPQGEPGPAGKDGAPGKDGAAGASPFPFAFTFDVEGTLYTITCDTSGCVAS
jgi:Collagen triple helix repeat (20 copies)